MSEHNLNSKVTTSKDIDGERFENATKKEERSEDKFCSGSETNDNNSGNTKLNIHKSIKLSPDLKEKLIDLPDVVKYIEKLQKVIQKQFKKIVKWKMKAKQFSEKKAQDAVTQTSFDEIRKTVKTSNEHEAENKTNEEKSLAEDIREAAEQAMQSSGFVYEETSGLYYDYNSGYYYNAEYGLYYDGTTGTYLKYNQETQTYEFYSQVSASESKSPTKVGSEIRSKRRSKNQKTSKDLKRQRRHHPDTTEDIEEGECSDSSASSSESDDNSVSDSSDVCKKWPPCMRMIVESTEIPKIRTGTLFIITCDGGTIGREGNHAVCLPDVNVSKHHLKVTYNSDLFKYMITDLGSRNGTMLNGKRISASKQESEPIEISHGNKLQLGATTLLCHIHEGSQTCGHCEPGLLIEDDKDPPVLGKSMRNINQQYKAELRRLRKQHGFMGSIEETSKVAAGYTDRAQRRRETIGSQNPYEKTQAASLDESISSENKGFKLLSKMGWKEGQSLGKDGTGNVEPIKLKSNIGTSGVGAAVEQTACVPGNESKQIIWKKTQERFDKLPDKNIFDEDSEG